MIERSISCIYNNDMVAAWEMLVEGATLAREHDQKAMQFFALFAYAIYLDKHGEGHKSLALMTMLQKSEYLTAVRMIPQWLDILQSRLQEALSETDYQATVARGETLDYETELAAFYAAIE
jgi:hypothetical protein